MQTDTNNVETEIEDLKHELESFQKEKERVRTIIGKIGGVPKFSTKIINTLFMIGVIVPVIISVFTGEKLQILMIELATVMLSLKIIYLIHNQAKVNHFKFWILSSLEWRINEIAKHVKEIKKELSIK